MKRWYRENSISVAIAGAIAILLSVYVMNQQPQKQIENPEATETIEETQTEPQPEIAPEEIPTVQEPNETEKAENETQFEENETENVEIETEFEEVKYFDVPLSNELQDFIFAECEKHNIAPAIIIAMIERESSFRAHVIGDNGTSFGLMQIKEKYQKERMKRLGCTDLLNPFENVKVGIDIVAELKEKKADLYWVLMAYNGGQSYANKRYKSGKISNYALEVVERAEELTESLEN